MLGALGLAAAAFRLLAPPAFGSPWLLGGLAVLALAWVALQPRDVVRDDTLPALAVVIAALGLLLVARLSPALATRQTLWLVFSLALAVTAGPAFTRFRVLAAYTYVWIVVAIVLFVALALFLALPPKGSQPPEFLEFLGRFHTMA